jgi:hypothetical protein
MQSTNFSKSSAIDIRSTNIWITKSRLCSKSTNRRTPATFSLGNSLDLIRRRPFVRFRCDPYGNSVGDPLNFRKRSPAKTSKYSAGARDDIPQHHISCLQHLPEEIVNAMDKSARNRRTDILRVRYLGNIWIWYGLRSGYCPRKTASSAVGFRCRDVFQIRLE